MVCSHVTVTYTVDVCVWAKTINGNTIEVKEATSYHDLISFDSCFTQSFTRNRYRKRSKLCCDLSLYI